MKKTGRITHGVQACGKKFPSISAFASHYGLKYTTVVYHLRRGKSGDEILEILGDLPSSTRYKKAPSIACPCTYAGTTYPSITAAAEALGIPAHQVYAERHNNNITPEEAIQRVLERKEENGDIGAALTKRQHQCTIEGTTYPSKSAAARAYGIPLVTIQSRMAREGITFEEALCRGKKERRSIRPVQSIWNNLHLTPCPIDDDTAPTLMSQISQALKQSAYEPTWFVDENNAYHAITIQESIRVLGCVRTIYILVPDNDRTKDLEIAIPSLMALKENLDSEARIDLLAELNYLNSTYLGGKISMQKNMLMVNWSQPITYNSFNIRPFLRTVHRLIGTAAAMYNYLQSSEQQYE